MLKISEIMTTEVNPSDSLTLSFEYRQKSRQRVTLDSGEDAGVYLPRGIVLRNGDMLKADDQRIIRIIAAPESTSVVRSDDVLLLMRACYHLGNRHIPLQIEIQAVRYRHDHVLDDMVVSLGLQVEQEMAAFEPESGAYHSHSGGHQHGHEH